MPCMNDFRVINRTPDPEVERIIDRLLHQTAEDRVQWERFKKLRELVANCRATLAPLDERQWQLIGLYLLSACHLGEGEHYDPMPTLEPKRQPPILTVIGKDMR